MAAVWNYFKVRRQCYSKMQYVGIQHYDISPLFIHFFPIITKAASSVELALNRTLGCGTVKKSAVSVTNLIVQSN